MAGTEITPDEIKDGSYVSKMKEISAAEWVNENPIPTVVAYGTCDRIQPFLGIEALKNQTLVQKLVFFGSVILGVLANVLLPIYCGTPAIVCIMIFMVFLVIGVGFGCNYTEDMTYGRYLYWFLSL